MANIISIFNTAGGVGKSTLTQNLGYHFSQLDKKVLLIDLDTNSSLTEFCGIINTEEIITVYDSFYNREVLNPLELKDFDICCSDINLVAAEFSLIEEAIKRKQNYHTYLQDILKPIADNYDIVLIDCPASFGLLAVNALYCSEYILIPFATYFKAYKALDKLFTVYQIVTEGINPHLEILGIVPSKYDIRTKQCRLMLETLESNLAESEIEIYPPIRKAIAFSNAVQENKPLAEYAKLHPQVRNLELIARQILAKLNRAT